MTVDSIKAKIEALESAQASAISGKSYSIDGVTYTRQDLSALEDLLHYWRARLAKAITQNPSSVTMRPSVCIDRGGCPWHR